MATTLDPANIFNGTLSNGNLTLSASAGNAQAFSTTNKSTGKWHLELTIGALSTNGNHGFGFSQFNTFKTNGIGTDSATPPVSFSLWTGVRTGANAIQLYWNSVTQVNFTAAGGAANDIVAIEIDFGARLLWFQVAYTGQWNNSSTANPATGVGGLSLSAFTAGSSYYFCVNPYLNGYVETVNFGATAFAVTPSSGFTAWDPGAAAPITKNAAALMVGV